MKTLITCGCSFSYGLCVPRNNKTNRVIREEISQVQNYTNFLSEKFNLEYTNLSSPGASNYFIVKQVQKAIESKPDLIVFNTTSVQRLDFVPTCKKLDTVPTYDDFFDTMKYSSKNRITNSSDNKKIISSVEYAFTAKYWLDDSIFAEEFYTDFSALHEYLINYSNFHLTRDKYKYMLLGILYELDKSSIPYIIIDFYNYFTFQNKNILNLPISEILSKFSFEKDPYHFNEDGHRYLTAKLADIILNEL